MTGRVSCALLVPSAHHKRSTGAWYNNARYLDKGREKAASRITCGVGVGSPPALQAEACWFPVAQDTRCARILVTREPTSSWTANTSLQEAFQEEVATSDLGGRRPKVGTIWEATGSANEAPVAWFSLHSKENPRSQCSGCEPATACLEGWVSHSRRLPAMNWLYWLMETIDRTCVRP